MINDALKKQIADVNSYASYRLVDGYCLDAELDAKFIQRPPWCPGFEVEPK